MSHHRKNPESEENAAMTQENQRAVFAAKMMAEHATDEKPPVAALTPPACSPKMARQWSLMFETYDGMSHPLRITFRDEGSEEAARRYGEQYLVNNGRWLNKLTECYPTASENLECSHGANIEK